MHGIDDRKKRHRASDSSLNSSINSVSGSPVTNPHKKHRDMSHKEVSGTQSETKMDILLTKMNDLQTSVDKNNAMLVDMKSGLDAVVSTNKTLTHAVSDLKLQNDIKDAKIHQLESRLDVSEGRWYENNLLFCGIPEKSADANCELLVRVIMTELGVVSNDRTLLCAYRLGKASVNRSRPIVARYQHIKDKNIVWAKRRDIKSEQIYIRSMHSPSTYRKRRVLQAVANYADSIPSYKGSVRLTHNHTLQIGRSQYGIHELSKLPIDLQKCVASRIDGDFNMFFGMESPFSNFYPSPFVVDGVAYSCNEQYYYASKARHFSDRDTEIRIMATVDPAMIKRIGMAISTEEKEWNKGSDALGIMHTGLHAKFSQNPYLSRVLLSTGEDTLAEANPHDLVWGIGLHKNDPKAISRSDWKGTNQLGDLLMTVRYDIRSQL